MHYTQKLATLLLSQVLLHFNLATFTGTVETLSPINHRGKILDRSPADTLPAPTNLAGTSLTSRRRLLPGMAKGGL